jgi:preprotein translocase subunit SecG
LFLFLFILVVGCQHKDKEAINTQPNLISEERDIKKSDEAPTTSMQKIKTGVQQTDKEAGNITTQNAQNIDVTKRMIIRTGSMSVEVEKFDDAEKTVTDVVKKTGGYISNTTSTQNSSGKKQGTLVLKVPADKYDALIAEVSAIGKVMNQNINANDITEEYIDLEARQKTQKELEQRLLKLLSEKTARLTDVVEVEQKLASVRQIIESIDGKLRYLRNQSEMSTLTLSLYEPAILQTSSGGGFFYELGQGVKKGLRGFTEILSGMIMLLIALLPIIILVLIILWIIRRIIKNRKKKNVQV